MTRLVAFAGFARSGKDSLAAAFVERGFEIFNYGNVIKGFYAPFISGEEGATSLIQRMREANPELGNNELLNFLVDVMIPFREKGVFGDAFTEDDAFKVRIRPILEMGGDLIYDWVMREYFRVVDAKWSAGKNVVNTRLVRIPEAKAWKQRGGVIYLVQRKDWPAASEWEESALETLRASGYIDGVLHNDGTAEDWQATARRFAEQLTTEDSA